MAVVGLGTDIAEIERFQMEKEKLDRLARRVLTDSELTVFEQSNFPERYLAKRFAAKEAAVKAIGIGIGNGVSFHHVEVNNDKFGKPILTFHGKMRDLCQELNVVRSHISISDERHYAVATVILESDKW